MSCDTSRSLEHCTCSYTACDKRGNCCRCVTFHRGRGEVPGCLFTPAGERTYDRSLASFLRDQTP